MVLSFGVCGAFADDGALSATEGEELVLFDKDGIKLTLTGEHEINTNAKGDLRLDLSAVAENNTDTAIKLYCSGTVNGWSTSSTQLLGNTPQDGIPAGAKLKTYIWFFMDDVDISAYEDLEVAKLTFNMWTADLNAINTDPLTECTIYFNGSAPAGSDAEGAAAPIEEKEEEQTNY